MWNVPHRVHLNWTRSFVGVTVLRSSRNWRPQELGRGSRSRRGLLLVLSLLFLSLISGCWEVNSLCQALLPPWCSAFPDRINKAYDKRKPWTKTWPFLSTCLSGTFSQWRKVWDNSQVQCSHLTQEDLKINKGRKLQEQHWTAILQVLNCQLTFFFN